MSGTIVGQVDCAFHTCNKPATRLCENEHGQFAVCDYHAKLVDGPDTDCQKVQSGQQQGPG